MADETVLLPAEPAGEVKLFLTPEQFALLARTLQPSADHYVRAVDALPAPPERKHEVVRSVLSDVAASQLQHSFRELHGVPPELLAAGVDLLIQMAVRGLRRAIP